MRTWRGLPAIVSLLGLIGLLSWGCSKDTKSSIDSAVVSTTPDLVYREVNYGVNPAAQWVIVRNTGGGTMPYGARIASGNTWIGLYASTNSVAPDSFIVNFQLGLTQAGTYYDTIIIEAPLANNTPYRLPVQLVVRNILQTDPAGFTFAMPSGGADPDPQKLSLAANSTTPIDLAITHSSTWLTLDKDMARTPDTVTLTASGSALSPGVYHDTLLLNATTIQSQVKVPCSLVVASWLASPLAQQRDLRDVWFVDANRGFAVGALTDASGGGLILHTLNGGASWTTSAVPSQAVGNIQFVDADNGWAVGTRQVRRTRNGSADNPTWDSLLVPDTVNAVCFIDTTLGWLVGKDGYVLRTTNGGANWSQMQSNTSFSLVKVQFVSPDSGWAVGNNGVIMFSADSGSHWVRQDWGGTDDIYDVRFTNNLNGWAVGAFGLVLHTTNGGVDWNPVTTPATGDLSSIAISPGGFIWIAGADGLIIHSENGVGFGAQPTGVTERLKSLFFLDDNVGWAVGEQGMVLKTIGGGI